jgi:hypothetical protein
VIPGLAVARPVLCAEVRKLRAGAPVRQICAAHPGEPFQPPAVRAMITSLETITQRLRNPADAPWLTEAGVRGRVSRFQRQPADRRMAQQDTCGMTSPAISSIWRRSSPSGQK